MNDCSIIANDCPTVVAIGSTMFLTQPDVSRERQQGGDSKHRCEALTSLRSLKRVGMLQLLVRANVRRSPVAARDRTRDRHVQRLVGLR